MTLGAYAALNDGSFHAEKSTGVSVRGRTRAF
jgi:hypothetical protein